MPATNGHTRTASADLEALQREAEVERAKAEVYALKAENALYESVLPMAGYSPTWYGGFHAPDGYYQHDFPSGLGYGRPGFGGVDDRRGGRNRPFAWGDVDLDRIRSAARWVAATNGLGLGVVDCLSDYTVRTGYGYEARPSKRLIRDRAALVAAAEVQACIDDFLSLNTLGEEPAELLTWADRERACVAASVVDGECFLRTFDQGDGTTLVRPIDAEQVRQDPATEGDPSCTWGVVTPAGDAEGRECYHVTYDGTSFEHVDGDEVHHLKLNVPSTVKRGLSDFFAVEESFRSVGKLLRNMGITSGVQAAVAWIEEHVQATQSQVSAWVGSMRALNAPRYTHPYTGREEKTDYIPPGTERHVNEGRKFHDPPVPAAADKHIAVVQACLRSAGARWRMPEYMISGDASNAAFASTMVAGAPFVVAVECRQAMYGRYFLRVLWAAIRNACRAGRFVVNGRRLNYGEVCRMVDVVPTPPMVAIANQREQSEIDQGAIAAGYMSLQTAAKRRGLDFEQEQRNIEAYPPTRVAHRVQDVDPQGNPVGGFGGRQGQQGMPAGPPTGLDRGPVREAKEEGEGDRRERAEMIADVLYGLYGDDALKLFTQASEQAESRLHECAGFGLWEAWNELDHPRDEKTGRFIPKGSAEAVSAATAAVNKAIKGDRTAGSAEEVAKHLANLTVKQLRAIWKEHGVQAGREVRESLVNAVLERLPKDEPKKEEKPQEKPAAKPKAPHEMTKAEHAQSMRVPAPTPEEIKAEKKRLSGQVSTHSLTPQQAEDRLKAFKSRHEGGDAIADFYHRKHVEKALERGKPVPPEVLADYPDLAKQQPGAGAGDVHALLSQNPGVPMEMADLRKQSGLSKPAFDREIERLADEGKIALQRHNWPDRLPPEQQAELVRIGDERFGFAFAREAEPEGPSPFEVPAEPRISGRDLQRLADETATGGFHDNKVFISHAYETAKKAHPGLTMDAFKRQLLDANARHELHLSRADMVQYMDPRDVEASETAVPGTGSEWSPGATFHFILSDRPDRAQTDPAGTKKQQGGGATAEAALSALAETPVADLGELRSRLKLPPAEFDKLMLDLHDSGDVVLSQDASPEAHSPEKLAGYVRDGDAVFTTATLSDAARERLGGGKAPESATHQATHREFFKAEIDKAVADHGEAKGRLAKLAPREAQKSADQLRRDIVQSSSHRPEVQRAIRDVVSADAAVKDALYYSQRPNSDHPRSQEHRAAVEAALAAGKNVPPEVLKDYPDLARRAGR